ncbi:MAG TPA: ATP synthase F0 subunit B [Acidimicrobiales bacterium]|nr:ATP synthase F0 subunit B [Acidimicrobiales bacterium]
MNAAPGSEQPDSETLLRRVLDILDSGKSVPLSTSVLVPSKDELVDLLTAALDRLPEELRQARWMLREREERVAQAQREASEIVAAAREQAERMVQRAEIVREAERVAARVVEDARLRAARMRSEADEYCEGRLAALGETLERTLRTVQAGMDKLRSVAPPAPAPVDVTDAARPSGPFDQDS